MRRESSAFAQNTWNGYKRYFIDATGEVMRVKERDAVSEGQAYAMLRSVWMGDKETFDKCYGWAEANLSRRKRGDNLLAWRWKDGSISDWMPASDADVDYALSLIFADAIWSDRAPSGLEDYGKKAKGLLGDILRLETYSTAKGRLYLSPWILNDKKMLRRFPVNPSYYSPAHFRVFYGYTKDERWLKLTDTSYYILNSLSREFDGEKGTGLIPDWCSVDDDDKFYPLEGKGSGFGWESVRIPLRVALDYFWFKSEQAEQFFNSGFSKFIDGEWQRNKKVFCEYAYSGKPKAKYENPLFYAAYYCALRINRRRPARDFLGKARAYIKRYGRDWVYQDTQEYYVNSLAWFPEGLNSGIIRLIERK